MRIRLGLVAALLAVAVAACNGPVPDPNPTAELLPTSTTTTTRPPTTTTTAPAVPLVEFRAIGVDTTGITVLPESHRISAGVGYQLGTAFDDLRGGLVYERFHDDAWSIWYLPTGQREPRPIGLDGARLGDVDALHERPVSMVSWTPDAVVVQVVDGGAPDVYPRVDLGLPSAHVSGISLGYTVMGVATVDDPDAQPVCHDLTIVALPSGAPGETLDLCSPLPPVVSPAGDLVVALDRGGRTVSFLDPEGALITRITVPTPVLSVDTSLRTAVISTPTGVLRIDTAGNRADLPWDPESTPLGATALRSPLVVSDFASIGGIDPPTDCSARDLPFTPTQTGLTPGADRTRVGLLGALTDCDLLRVASFAADPFDGPEDVFTALARWEATSVTATRQLVATLELPYGVISDADGRRFVWPAILGDRVAASDWTALETIYNLEHIEEWRTGRAEFDGWSVIIDESGSWISLGPGT